MIKSVTNTHVSSLLNSESQVRYEIPQYQREHSWPKAQRIGNAKSGSQETGGNMKRLDFSTLYFGEASAEREVAKDSERFKRTYLDLWNVRTKLERNDFFLILGPKGSGKTAVGEYCRLSMQDSFGAESVLALSKNMDELSPNIAPLASITSKLASENAQGVSVAAWRLYIGLQLATLARRDQSSTLQSDARFSKLWSELKDAGLVITETELADYPTVLRRVREGRLTFSAKLFVSETKSTSIDEISVDQLGAAMIKAVVTADSPCHYLLVIDGLDRIIGNNPAYWISLSSLLMAASDIHLDLQAAQSRVRLLVMCRTDVFRKVRFADADKIAGDASIFVDWANQQTKVADSSLWDYLAKKACVSVEELLNSLPQFVTVGERASGARKIEGDSFLFSSTRSTPREFTMLMRQIQRATPPGQALTGERLRSAVDNFASQDLLSILMAEASGVLDEHVRDRLPTVLSCLPRASRIDREDMQAAVVSAGLPATTTAEILSFLFLAGALGNLNVDTSYVQFYYRRDTYAFRQSGPWILHRGLMYAFNIPW